VIGTKLKHCEADCVGVNDGTSSFDLYLYTGTDFAGTTQPACIHDCSLTTDQSYFYHYGTSNQNKICHNSSTSPRADSATNGTTFFRKKVASKQWVHDCLFSRVSKECMAVTVNGSPAEVCHPTTNTDSAKEMFRVIFWVTGNEDTTSLSLVSAPYTPGMFNRLLQEDSEKYLSSKTRQLRMLTGANDLYVPYCAQRCPQNPAGSSTMAFSKTISVNGVNHTEWQCSEFCPPSESSVGNTPLAGYTNLVYYNRLTNTHPPQCVADCLHNQGLFECVSSCVSPFEYHDRETNTCKASCAAPRPKYFVEPVSSIKYCVDACDKDVISDAGTQRFIFTDGNQCVQTCGSTQFYKDLICQDTFNKMTAGDWANMSTLTCNCVANLSNCDINSEYFVDIPNGNKYCVGACTSSVVATQDPSTNIFRFTDGN